MFRFVYNHTDYDAFMHDMAEAMGVVYNNNRIVLPQHICKGYYRLLLLPNGLQSIIADQQFNDNVIFERQKSAEPIYTLRFNELSVPDKITLTIDADRMENVNLHRSVVFLSSSVFDVAFHATPGTVMRSINILFSKEWLAKYLGISETDDVLQRYLAMKINSIDVEQMDITYREWMDEVMGADDSQPLWKTVVQNRIMLMIERFFTGLYNRMQKIEEDPGLSPDDIRRVIETEALLTDDVSKLAPTINELARLAAMSASKLKKSFKQVYGLPIYEYYQKSRMQKARELLLTGDYSVKEVGMRLGYSNLSNFTLAFKKEFNLLPSDFART